MNESASVFQSDPEAEAREAGLYEAMFAPCEADPELRCYLLLDAAASSDIPICLEGFNADARCLFDGMARDDLGDVAPWLVEVRRHEPVVGWYAEEGHGKNWGIILHSRLEPQRLKARLKRFLKITDEFDDRYFFKFYLPRNLNAVLPEFEPDQRESFFNGIVDIFAEDRLDAGILRRHGRDTGLTPEPIDLVELGRRFVHDPADAEAAAEAILAQMRDQI